MNELYNVHTIVYKYIYYYLKICIIMSRQLRERKILDVIVNFPHSPYFPIRLPLLFYINISYSLMFELTFISFILLVVWPRGDSECRQCVVGCWVVQDDRNRCGGQGCPG